MYTINGKYIKSFPKNNKEKFKSINKDRIIETMSNTNNNATASFHSLKLHDGDKDPVHINYTNDRFSLSKENKDNTMKTILDADFKNEALSVYSNMSLQNNLIFYPDEDEDKKEINKGIIFYNKDKKIVGAIHKDSQDKSDLVFRTGYSDEQATGLSERMRILNSENRIKISGSVDANQICLGNTCLNEVELKKLKSIINKSNKKN